MEQRDLAKTMLEEYLDLQADIGCSCNKCMSNAEKYFRFGERGLQEAERCFKTNVLYHLQKGIQEKGKEYKPFTRHYQKQAYQRALNDRQVLNALFNAKVVESVSSKVMKEIKMLLVSAINDRAIHISISYNYETKNLQILTAYHPDTEFWRWTDEYDQRIFDCQREEEFRYEKNLGNRT